MALFTRNVDLGSPLRTSSRRKVAIGTWDGPGDPSVYGIAEYDATAALAYIERLSKETGQRITLSHFVGKALAMMINRHPSINCLLRLGRLYPRKSIDISFLVATDAEGRDLSALMIREADEKTIPEIAREMQSHVDEIRQKGDPAFRQMKKTVSGIPGFAARALLKASEFLMYVLNLWSPLLGTPRDPFGSAMITNIGSLGLDTAFAPLVPYSRVPLLITMGTAQDRPVARDGKVIVAPMLRLCVTFDHRLIDGVQASHMARSMAEIFADPERHLPVGPTLKL